MASDGECHVKLNFLQVNYEIFIFGVDSLSLWTTKITQTISFKALVNLKTGLNPLRRLFHAPHDPMLLKVRVVIGLIIFYRKRRLWEAIILPLRVWKN